MSKEKLKIALLINSYHVATWIFAIIEELNKSNHFDIVLAITKESSNSQNNKWTLNNFLLNLNHILFNLFLKIENKLFNNYFDVFKPKNLKDLLLCDELIISSNNELLGNSLNEKQINLIKAKQLDVIISFGLKELESALLNFTSSGIWYYTHGNYTLNNSDLSGVWEVFKKNDDTKVTLNISRKEKPSKLVIYETSFNTDHLYIWRNKHVVFWNSKSILPVKLNHLYKIGKEQFFKNQCFKNLNKQNNSLKTYNAPNNFETLKYVIKLYAVAFKKVLNRQFYFDQWILLFNLDKNDTLNKSFNTYTRLLPPKDRFWADPFILKKNDIYYIFFEELIYTENKGKIALIEMDNNGNYTNPKVVLETKYHLSYPFLIEDNGELYMLPETEENRTIELYKCIEFPNKWELKKVLLNNLKAVDSTIFKFNNKYWLFTNINEYKGEYLINELFLFYSDNLFDDNWTSHPQNPITTDRAYSRPAGNIFVHENRIYRPSQNCSKHYGYGIQLQEIVKMTTTEYEEKNVESIYPNWDKDLVSTHTLNKSGNLTFIDAQINRNKLL